MSIFQASLKSERITGTLHEDRCTFFITSHLILLRMRNVSEKYCRENQNTHFTFRNYFFDNRTIYEIILKNIAMQGRPQITLWRMRITMLGN
jgi:hypothetical protein